MRAVFWIVAVALIAASDPTNAAESYRDCADCPLMVTIPGGSFSMGSSPSDISSVVSEGAKAENIQREAPQHDVMVQPFAMSVTEVTRDQFEAFVREDGYAVLGNCVGNVNGNIETNLGWRQPGFNQDGNHPVVCVNWDDAKAYARWLSRKTGKDYRLPTEAEWEYAARAGTATTRYWGMDSRSSGCSYANVADSTFQCNDGFATTAPVAQFQANAFGLNDMLGNVWEWTEDCYNASYNGAPADGSAWLTGDCSLRVARGGAWISPLWEVRFAGRFWLSAAERFHILGFRVSRTN